MCYFSLSHILTSIYCQTTVRLGFPCSPAGKESICLKCERPGFDPWVVLGRSLRSEYGNPLQYSCLENPHGQRSLAGYSLWGRNESDMTQSDTTHSPVRLHLLVTLLGVKYSTSETFLFWVTLIINEARKKLDFSEIVMSAYFCILLFWHSLYFLLEVWLDTCKMLLLYPTNPLLSF